MRFLFKETFDKYWMPLKLLSFTGLCFGNVCLGVLHKRRMTPLEIKEFCDYFKDETQEGVDP